jgi:hypothetical protein
VAEIDFIPITHVTPAVAAALTRCTYLSMRVSSLDDAQLHQLLASMLQLRQLYMVDSNRFDGEK